MNGFVDIGRYFFENLFQVVVGVRFFTATVCRNLFETRRNGRPNLFDRTYRRHNFQYARIEISIGNTRRFRFCLSDNVATSRYDSKVSALNKPI